MEKEKSQADIIKVDNRIFIGILVIIFDAIVYYVL